MKRGSRTDEILTLLFMIMAIGAVICFFAFSDNRIVFIALGGVAVILRIIQYILRFFP